MISYLEGTIAARGENSLVISAGGVGYKVFTTQDTLDALAGTERTAVWTHLAVRENALDLYGFTNQETLAFFELLITISGIGPKTALSILNLASVKTLRSAVASGDASRLTKVSGIGKKNAEKIVLELKSKIGDGDGTSLEEGAAMQDESDALEALQGLGYSERAAREALKKLDRSVTGTGEKVKHALKILAK